MDDQVEFQFGHKIDPFELGIYQSLSIIVDDSIVTTFHDEYYEFEGSAFVLNDLHKINTRNGTYYRVEMNNRPEPPIHWFFVYSENHIDFVGKIGPLDLKYIGDEDMDGKLEVSGYSDYCQEAILGERESPDFCADQYKTFEVSSKIEQITYSTGVTDLLIAQDFLPSPILDHPFIYGDFFGDGIQDTALIGIKGEEHRLMIVDYQPDTALIRIINADGDQIRTNDFSWVGVFKSIPAGDTLFSNYTDDWRSLNEVPDDEKVVLTYDAMYVHMAEACGGGFIFWKDDKWNWLQQE